MTILYSLLIFLALILGIVLLPIFLVVSIILIPVLIVFLLLLIVIVAIVGVIFGIFFVVSTFIMPLQFNEVNAFLAPEQVEVYREITDSLADDGNLYNNVEAVYLAKFLDSQECYVFKVEAENGYTSFDLYVVISKNDKNVLSIVPEEDAQFTTHGKDHLFINNKLGLVGCNFFELDDYYRPLAGATITCASYLNAVKLAFYQLEYIEK